ncbi:chemotaxis protein CheW [Simiduia litorea]|uniref:chemotaxis protein CheW n=1 Tax=Simiduia litorea TaxID=1435348 RepID=UPI0036F3F871
MKAKAAIQNQMAMDIPSLILPMSEHAMLAPTVSIAEIVPYARPELVPDAPDWLLGVFEWRKQKLPLISLEALRGEAVGDIGPRTRIAVFNNTGVNDELPFFAIQTQGIPRLSRVLASIIHEVEGVQIKPFERIRVDLEGEICSIPDVGALEQVILDYRRNGGAI